MPIGNWNLQWLNHNSQRSYPLTDRATKVDDSGTIRLPDSFIVALYLPIHSGLSFAPNNFFIRTVLISPTGFNVVVGYTASGVTTDVAAANIARAAFQPNRSYALGGIDNFDDCVGRVVIGTLDEIDKLPPGTYTFDKDSGELETDAIRPMLRAVSRLRVFNNNELSAPIYGDVTLVAGTNIRINVANVGGETEIIFDAIANTNLNQDCLCNVHDTGECIRCINGVCSSDGNFTFTQDDCVQITPIANGLSLADTCAAPCCGCAELDAITQQINRFGDGVTTLQNFVTRLGSEVTQMSLVVLGSRLGDSGCKSG
ncbi:hypothetical protein [Sphingorhabdus sp.]|uniref:hypothetical protein n=1 Tax=Sphingorhabdus sp. TaxID=1902408 RepID=UPI00334221AB